MAQSNRERSGKILGGQLNESRGASEAIAPSDRSLSVEERARIGLGREVYENAPLAVVARSRSVVSADAPVVSNKGARGTPSDVVGACGGAAACPLAGITCCSNGTLARAPRGRGTGDSVCERPTGAGEACDSSAV